VRVQATVFQKVATDKDDSLPELGVRTGMPLVAHHADGEQENEEIDGIQTGETGEPELTLAKGFAAVGVVVGEDVAGDEEEDADEDIAVVDEGIKKTEVRRSEVEENDEDCEQGTDAGALAGAVSGLGSGLAANSRMLVSICLQIRCSSFHSI
jgi:hypothetical protein